MAPFGLVVRVGVGIRFHLDICLVFLNDLFSFINVYN